MNNNNCRKILILLGHPAKNRKSFCETIAITYRDKALQAGHDVEYIKISDLDFDPILHEGYVGKQHQESDITEAQEKILWAEHLVIIYPLWQFMIPALLKGFFERTFTKGFVYDFEEDSFTNKKMLKGKSVRIIQTMGMPTIMYRLLTLQQAVRALKLTFKFCGMQQVRVTYFGLAENLTDKRLKKYTNKINKLAIYGQ